MIILAWIVCGFALCLVCEAILLWALGAKQILSDVQAYERLRGPYDPPDFV